MIYESSDVTCTDTDCVHNLHDAGWAACNLKRLRIDKDGICSSRELRPDAALPLVDQIGFEAQSTTETEGGENV